MSSIFDFDGPHYNVRNTGDSPKLIELAPIVIDYDQPLERMIGPKGRELFVAAMEEYVEGPIRYAVDYFPNCNAGRIGKQLRNLLLFRPTPLDGYWGLPHILSAIDEAGFVPEELPSLASLEPLTESLWTVFGGRVFLVNSVGPNSLMKLPNDSARTFGLDLATYDGELGSASYGEEDVLAGGHSGEMSWYVVSRKADD